MFNISENTAIRNFSGKSGALSVALHDKNAHRNTRFDYFGKRVQRGSVEALVGGNWLTVRFECKDGWARSLEVV